MGCQAGMWKHKVVNSIGGECCKRTEAFLFPKGHVFAAGTLFVVDEVQDDTSLFIRVRPMESADEQCVGILHCELDTTDWTEDCSGPLCIHGEYITDQIPWPEGWGMKEIKTVMHNCRCCGIYFHWPEWC